MGHCGLTELTTTRQLLSSGERRRDLLTVTPITAASAGARFRGRELKPGALLVLDPGGEAVQQVPAGHSQMALSIPLALFRRLARVEHGNEGERFLRWQAMQPLLCNASRPRVASPDIVAAARYRATIF